MRSVELGFACLLGCINCQKTHLKLGTWAHAEGCIYYFKQNKTKSGSLAGGVALERAVCRTGVRPAFQQYLALSAPGVRAVVGVRAPALPVPAAPSSRAAGGGARGLSGGGAAAGGDGGA